MFSILRIYAIENSLGNNTLNLSLISKFALSKSSGKINSQLALLPPDWSDFESIFHRLWANRVELRALFTAKPLSPLALLRANWVELRVLKQETANSHWIDLKTIEWSWELKKSEQLSTSTGMSCLRDNGKYSQNLTNQDEAEKVESTFSHSICSEQI